MTMTSPQEFNCIFCKESFENKEDLQIHFRKHGDPKFNQNVKNKSRLLSESQTSGDKPTEESEVVSCDVCTEVFPTISKAITHKHKVHPDHDAKYFCPWCGKLFTMKHLYNKHIEGNHNSEEDTEDKGFHCDYCEVEFFAPAAMVYHNKFFHRQDTELAAIGQSRKLKMFNQEPLQLYYCPFCGEEYFNKVNLHKHMGDDHIDEDQSPDDVLRCPLCNAIFYHLDAYEVHLTFHTSEDTYSEENEIVKEVTEFSLEAVPPIMEKVENCDSQEDAETTMNSIGIEKFLQQAMNESADNDNSNNECVPEKRKKHKKHKKSKKPAITLDEFLNMNKDVFGEGIDFQGVEEVPTQVVAKQLKRQALRPKLGPKVMPSTQLAKLKKQGIVVKMKSKNIPKVQGMNITKKPAGNSVSFPKKNIPSQIKSVPQLKSNTISTTSDVLTKLLNQNNSQLKIVKKSTQESSNSEQPKSSDMMTTPTDNDSDNVDKEECDEKNKNENKLTEENKNEPEVISSIDGNSKSEDIILNDNKTLEIANAKNTSLDTTMKSTNLNDIEKHDKNIIEQITSEFTNEDVQGHCNLSKETNNFDNKTKLDSINTKSANTLSALRNIRQHLTIKSVSSPKSIASPLKKLHQETDIHTPDIQEDHNVIEETKNSNETNNFDDKTKLESINKNSALCTLRNISQHVTIKSVSSPKSNASPLKNLQQETDDIHTSDIDKSEKEDHNVTEETNNVENKEQNGNISNVKAKNVLKHLSNFVTVKTVNQPKMPPIALKYHTFENETDYQETSQKEVMNKKDTIKETGITNSDSLAVKEMTDPPSNTLDALKNISKHLTIKSLIQPTTRSINDKYISNDSYDGDHDDDINDRVDDGISKNEFRNTDEYKYQANIKSSSNNKPLAVKTVTQVKSPEIMHQSPNHSPKAINKPTPTKVEKPDEKIHNEMMKKQSCVNILKQLPNVTAKSLNVAKNIQQVTSSVVKTSTQSMNIKKGSFVQKSVQNEETKTSTQSMNIKKGNFVQQSVQREEMKTSTQSMNIKKGSFVQQSVQKEETKTSTQSMNINKKGSFIQKSVQNENVKEEIEIFNIDDSDDEEVNVPDLSKNSSSIKAIMSSPQTTELKNKSMDALMNLSKHITVKPPNKQKTHESPKETLDDHHEVPIDNSGDDVNGTNVDNKHNIVKPTNQKNSALQHTLKNLSKHITVKSKNVSPGTRVKSLGTHFTNKSMLEDFDSDSNSSSKNVQITEVDDENVSDDEISPEINKSKQSYLAQNVIIQSPRESNSENEDFNEDDGVPSDTESNIKMSGSKTAPNLNTNKKPFTLNSFKNITVKSFKDDENFNEEGEIEETCEENVKIPNLSNELSIKPFKQMKPVRHDDSNTSSANKNVRQVSECVTNQSTANQRVSTSSDQINTVNKQVSVKTFQTQTVVQEITTTVTKTIRTVNQSVKQEVRNMSNVTSTPMIRPQKIQGMKPTQQIRNHPGIAVRQAPPYVGPRIRNAVTPGRSAVGATIRPSNQLVPVRLGMNQMRPNSPRMPITKKALATCRPQQPIMGKPLKISPNAMVSQLKRPASEDSSGPFSCFKKQKESLIPVPDLPAFDSSQERENSVHYASSSQMSKSKFTSSTKTVKGNTVVKSTQMKSEASASSEQLSRLNNMSGLKVVKTSQAKQVTQVEEQSAVSISKRNALEAIEKLQKHGLLVKKPRLDEDNYSDHSNCGDDDEFET